MGKSASAVSAKPSKCKAPVIVIRYMICKRGVRGVFNRPSNARKVPIIRPTMGK